MRTIVLAVTAILTSAAGGIETGKPYSATFKMLRPAGQHLTFDSNLKDHGPLLETRGQVFATGKSLYYRDWLIAEPGEEPIAGPNFDATSCSACHIETAVRSGATTIPFTRWIVKPVVSRHISHYGTQINLRNRFNLPAVDQLNIIIVPHEFIYPDGSKVHLSYPLATAKMQDGKWIPVGLRVAPSLFGWGLLEVANIEMIAHFHDPEDKNGDGISGRMIFNQGDQNLQVFGWKNSHATLSSQITAALKNDMGVTLALGCEIDCPTEINKSELHSLIEYVRSLGAPDRRHSPDVTGQHLFGLAGCSNCHTPILITNDNENPSLANQLIWPYSDLLLHDMGPLLADVGNVVDSSEWRTTPLWGIGLIETYYPERGFLHDGRAKSIEEAILWHGGEGTAARDYYSNLNKESRDALLNFVRSL
ncbi:MAG: hypothetical protein CMO98_02130 [Woeseia sp.]|nr:hypothetical protein [Woeseia sp.]|tara:strand:+ start:168 stop:1427 length:1260 start_codon:yes stop_codon:yes gene_type:complete